MNGKIGKGKGPKKKPSINELNENDRALYQEIMESVLRNQGIDPSIIQDEIKCRKEEKGQKFDNHKKACEILGINRTSSYGKYISVPKTDRTFLERNWVPGLVEWMRKQIQISDNVIGEISFTLCIVKVWKTIFHLMFLDFTENHSITNLQLMLGKIRINHLVRRSIRECLQ